MIYRIEETAVYEIQAASAVEAMKILMNHLTFLPDGAIHVRNVEVIDRMVIGAKTDDGTPAELAEEDVEAAMTLSRG
jgi:hypothetical protein